MPGGRKAIETVRVLGFVPPKCGLGFVSPKIHSKDLSGSFRQNPSFVMAGLDPAIHGEEPQRKAFVVAPPHGCAGRGPRMTWRGRCVNFSIVIFSMHCVEPRGSVAARRIPADCRAKLSFEPFALPIKREAERRKSRARNAAPVGPSCDRTCPSSGRELPAHNADRRASRRSTAAFSLSPGTAFWKRTGAPIRTPLIPRAFTRVHPPPPARCRTDPHSWAGQCLPRPPEIRLRRPDPQAPHPFHHLDASR